ncbi:MAG: hypothetical protein ACOZAN_04745 [Patescibacteria group bacterium]
MKIQKILVASVLASLLLTGFASKAGAQTTQEQSQGQNLKIHCETGSYGQNVNCWAEGTQNQSQKVVLEDGRLVVYRDGRIIPAHQIVDTAMDSKQLMGVIGVLAVGLAVTVYKYKTNR